MDLSGLRSAANLEAAEQILQHLPAAPGGRESAAAGGRTVRQPPLPRRNAGGQSGRVPHPRCQPGQGHQLVGQEAGPVHGPGGGQGGQEDENYDQHHATQSQVIYYSFCIVFQCRDECCGIGIGFKSAPTVNNRVNRRAPTPDEKAV